LIRLILLLGSLLALFNPVRAGEMVLIIDDLGNHQRDLGFFSLPQGITFAILPHTPYADTIASRSLESGRELMLHLPMEAHNGKRMGPGGLSSQMSEQAFRASLRQVLNSYPQVQGVNNHMGSKLSELTEQMDWFIDEIQQRQLYFIDSRTSARSVAEARARQKLTLVGRRDLFLDHYQSEAFIASQLKRAAKLAAAGEVPVVLGHPYPATLQALQKLLPELLASGIRIIPASQGLLREKQIAAAANQPPQVIGVALQAE